jgi:hypothetical protein
MEINVTHMVENADKMRFLSGSVAELGDNAGALTWNNSKDYSLAHPLLRDDQIEDAKDYFAQYGAWSKAEIEAWSAHEVQALLAQEVAASIREIMDYDTEEDYQKALEDGQVRGNLGKGTDGRWYYYMGM